MTSFTTAAIFGDATKQHRRIFGTGSFQEIMLRPDWQYNYWINARPPGAPPVENALFYWRASVEHRLLLQLERLAALS